MFEGLFVLLSLVEDRMKEKTAPMEMNINVVEMWRCDECGALIQGGNACPECLSRRH